MPSHDGEDPRSPRNAWLFRNYSSACNQENTLRSALTCDRDLAFTTFMNDPQMTLDATDGKKLFEEMLEAQRKYLPAKWFE